MLKSCLLSAAAAIIAAPALAQSTPSRDDVHEGEAEEIIVTANYIDDLDLLAGTSTLSGEDLARDLRPQIGDTLTRLPGVSATSFSPGASRPVLRGFQGERIRVLTDGIGSIDASNTSADHAVTIDPLTAERVEVLHGPAVLLFGSQAIGGAVNILDRRIPRRVPHPFHLDALASYGSAAEERSVGGSLDLPIGGGFVAHIDGSYRKSDDLRTGGYILSPELRAEQLHIAEEELEEGHDEEAAEALELAGQKGRLPNSATESRTLGAGLALIRDGGSIGFSVSWFDTDYGVPTRPGAHHHHEEGGEAGEGEEKPHEHGEEAISIGLEQVRADMRAEVQVGGGFLDAIRARLGYSDYEHTEFEGEEVGTVFMVNGLEGRLELVQADQEGWRGVSGAQFFQRDFAAIGAEAFVPPNETSQAGIFTLQELDLGGGFGLEGAARYERSHVRALSLDIERDFEAWSAALGASYELTPRVKIGANASRAERAPSAEELFSYGPHVATQAFEVGDAGLSTEKSVGAEAYVRGTLAGVTFKLSGFANWFDDYIYQTATGEEEDELPVFQYFQQGATYYGFEAEASVPLATLGDYRLVADGVADYVRASLEDGSPVPRIPPLRLLGGLEAQSDHLDARAEVEWVSEQDRTAEYETATEGFTLVNASLAWRPWGENRNVTLLASANNIFDVEARRHASFTKDFVPLAGRDFRVSARVSF